MGQSESRSAGKKEEETESCMFFYETKLPKELVWMVIERAPDAILELRATCRSLKSYVDEWASQPTPPSCLHMLTIAVKRKRENVVLHITMDVLASKSKLFALRRNLIRLSTKNQGLRKIDCCWLNSYALNQFGFIMALNHKSENVIEREIKFLRNFIGRWIEGPVRINCYAASFSREISTILEGVRFRTLDIGGTIGSQEIFAQFIALIRTKEVDKVALDIEAIAVPNPEKVLIELSSSVRTMLIRKRNYGPHDAPEPNWSPTILKMFSRKLDKLYLHGPHYRSACQDLINIRELLPTLGKPIWFECDTAADENLNYTLNDHIIICGHPTSFHLCRGLSIKHMTRWQEALWD